MNLHTTEPYNEKVQWKWKCAMMDKYKGNECADEIEVVEPCGLS